jgi:hypothetical protein
VLRFVFTVLLPLVLTIYTLVECIQTPEDRVRNLQKLIWLLLIVIAPVVGPIAWLVAGRPVSILPPGLGGPPQGGRNPRGPQGPRGPEDDPDFLRRL